ncbi:MAG TPA: cytochrome P450 [Microvirga sp.]|jgi:cytochrome P450|nr:cytochrome P450 [Microvirga sp.]
MATTNEGDSDYTPPAPVPRRMLGLPDGDLLTMLPARCFEELTLHVGARRKQPLLITSNPALVRTVLGDDGSLFARSQEVVSAFGPLMGRGLFLVTGEAWRRQRAMLEPAVGHLRVRAMFPHMRAALERFATRAVASAGEPMDLSAEMHGLVLDIICRTIFSAPLTSDEATELRALFDEFQRVAPETNPLALLGRPADRQAADDFQKASTSLRRFIAGRLERRLAGKDRYDADLLQAIIDARDPQSGIGFTREEIIDQVAVFFFAGHDTSAMALTWALFILAQQEKVACAMREEAVTLAPGRCLEADDVRQLAYTRQVMLEVLRLYPSAGFISRTVQHPVNLDGFDLTAGTLVVTSPWIVHRHPLVWERPEVFWPDRFTRERERAIPAGAFIPFGHGPRACTGRALAMAEIPFLLAELTRRLRLQVLNAEAAMPIARLTLKPKVAIRCSFTALSTTA